MNSNINPILSMLDDFTTNGDVLRAISKRQQMNANNIANAHTPGYQAQHASFADLLGNLSSPFETRLSKQMGASGVTENITGSNQPVNLQQELGQIQQNNLYYAVETRLVSSIFSGMKSAIQVGR